MPEFSQKNLCLAADGKLRGMWVDMTCVGRWMGPGVVKAVEMKVRRCIPEVILVRADPDRQGVGDDGWLESGWGTWKRHKG